MNLEEALKHSSWVKNPRLYAPDLFVHNVEFFDEEFECTYPSQIPNGEPWLHSTYGMICPYIQKGTFRIRCAYSRCRFIGGVNGVISDSQARAYGWEPSFEQIYWDSLK